MQAGEASKLLHDNMYSRTWEQDTPAGSFIGKLEIIRSCSSVGAEFLAEELRANLCRRWLWERRDHPEGGQCSAAAAAHCKRAERAPIGVAQCSTAWPLSQQLLNKLHLDVLWHSFPVNSTRTCCSARSTRQTSRPSQMFVRIMPDQSSRPFQMKKVPCCQNWQNF